MTDVTSPPMKTSAPRIDRTIAAILLATIFILANVPALYLLDDRARIRFPCR